MTPSVEVAAARPRLHLTPRTGWLNDPLALTWDGEAYHLFFQHVPRSVAWAAHCHWGRATSPDLLHWEQQPVALEPAADELGAWSGCLVEGRIFYTSVVAEDVERGRVRVARPTPQGWARWDPGEVVVPTPADAEVRYFRDPFVVRDGDRWRMLVGAGLSDGTGCVYGYVSDDLASWDDDGVVAARHTHETAGAWTGAIWECPQLLRLPEADVLVLSPADPDAPGDVVAGVGAFADGRFEATSWQRLTVGAPYAASVFRDREGEPGLVAWLRGVAGDGWAGAVSLPLRLDVVDGRARLAPHPAVAHHRAAWDPRSGSWELEWDGTGELTLRTPTGEPAVALRAADGELSLSCGRQRLRLDHDGRSVTVLRDGPVLEVVAAGRLAATPVSPAPLRPEGRGWRGWSLG